MSKETSTWLNTMVLVGQTDKRGTAWHHRGDLQTPWSVTLPDGTTLSGTGNHYPGYIPVEHVTGRLFNWEALEAPVFAQVGILPDGTAEYEPIPNQKRIYPSDDPAHTFWIAKDSYQPHDYTDTLVNSLADIIDTSQEDLGITSAGLLRQRAVAWVEISVPDTIVTPEGIAFRPNILATTSLNGTSATIWKRTVTDTVCDNTRTIALAEKGQQYKIRHSKYSNLKLADARQALNIIHTTADDIEQEFAELCRIEVTDKQFFDIVNAVLMPKGEPESKNGKTLVEKKKGELSQLWRNDNRVSPWANTAYGTVQAFNTWEQHFKGTRKGTQVAERNMLETINGGIEENDRMVYATMMRVLDNA